MTRRQIAATLLVTAPLAYLAAQGVAAPLALLLPVSAAGVYVVFAAGQLVMRASGTADLPLAAAWALGVAATGPVLYLLLALFPITAASAFALWAAVVIVLDIAVRRRAAAEPAPDRIDLAGLALCGAFTVVWCRNLAAAPAVLAADGFLPAWIDYFIHAGVISQFGDERAIGRGAIWLADFPKPAYHYASYTLPAALAAPLDQPGLSLATSAWVPIGFLSLATAAYTLGATLAGSAGGVAALIALFVVPDASNYWLRNGYFSFHWNLIAHPGATYALGSALLAAVFLQRWMAARSRAVLAASAALVATTFLFRVHVFLLLFPAWLAAVAVASRTVQRRRALFLILAGALALAVVLALRLAPPLPAGESWAFGEGRALERFLRIVHRHQEPTGYQGLYLHLQTEYGDTFALVAGALLVYPVLLGAFLLLLPVALWLERAAVRIRGIDAFPVALLVCFAALMAFAPVPSHQDATDLIHRPSVLLYAVTAIWTLALLVRWLSSQGAHGATRLWQTLALAALAALPLMWSAAPDLIRPKFNWGRSIAAQRVERDLQAAAAFLRERSRRGDTLATTDLRASYAPIDAPAALVALTAVPAYLARPWYHVFLGGARGELARARFGALRAIELERDSETALRWLREIGVRWYVATASGVPAWDPGHRRASFARGTVAVYEVRP